MPRWSPRQRGGGRGWRGGPWPSRRYPPPSDPPVVFSMLDEARSTGHGNFSWDQNSRLRNRPVQFVSVGTIDPLKQLEEQLQKNAQIALDGLATTKTPKNGPEGAKPNVNETGNIDAKMELATSTTSFGVPASDINTTVNARNVDQRQELTCGIGTLEISESQSGVSSQKATTNNSEDRFRTPEPSQWFIDTARRPLQRQHAPEAEEKEPAAASTPDSEEEVILFKGRHHQPTQQNNRAKKSEPLDLEEMRTELNVIDQKHGPGSIRTHSSSFKTSFNRGYSSHKKPNKASFNLVDADSDDDALIADYISNMRENGEHGDLLDNLGQLSRDIGGSDMELGDAGTARPSGTSQDLEGDDTSSTHSSVDMSAGESNLAVAEGIANSPFSHRPDEFDDHDWDVPASRSQRKKGKGHQPVFDISDSELESQMQAAYKADRLKKSERKKQRETMREQGLLRRNADPEDLSIKYPNGMNLDNIGVELRKFLVSSQASITLPPMDNHGRKIVHELANKLNLKSKSKGSGDQRRPTLSRTLRTPKFADETFDLVISRIGRKYFGRRDKAPAWQAKPHQRGSRALAYRDGEVVGGSAPELGQENRGRTMLEKMGWSTGTALGAASNKGILLPVEHVVKRGKAGLG